MKSSARPSGRGCNRLKGIRRKYTPATVATAGTGAGAAGNKFASDNSRSPVYLRTVLEFLAWSKQRGIGLAKVTPAMIEEFLASGTLQEVTVRRQRSALRAFFGVLAARRTVPCNPVRPQRQDANRTGRRWRVP